MFCANKSFKNTIYSRNLEFKSRLAHQKETDIRKDIRFLFQLKDWIRTRNLFWYIKNFLLTLKKSYDKIIKQKAAEGTPIMGICLGMQLLFEKSYEYGEHDGLGLISGEVISMENTIRLQHGQQPHKRSSTKRNRSGS